MVIDGISSELLVSILMMKLTECCGYSADSDAPLRVAVEGVL